MKYLEEVIINYDKKLMKAKFEIERLKEENQDLKEFISDYSLRLTHILKEGSKKYIRENLQIVINYMTDYLLKILKEDADDE